MRRRILCFFLAGLVVLGSVLSCLPLRASAIVPLGFVQSALASYVSSTGYKLYNDNGTGQDILGSLGELYDDYVTVSNKTITGQLANLAFLANSPYIYQDNSGQIVVSKVAADIFQDFANWIQTEYNVTAGSDSPTEVVSPSGGSISGNNASYPSGFNYSFWQPPIALTRGSVEVIFVQYGNTVTRTYSGNYQYAAMFRQTVSTSSSPYNYQVFFISTQPFTANSSSGNTYSSTAYTINDNQFYGAFASGSAGLTSVNGSPYNELRGRVASIQAESALKDLYRFVYGGTLSESGGVVGLGVTLASAVADVVGQAKEDDAVVIGVGASAGATAQDIADMVAQGVKAQTLDPSVSITAESVIDTPVQPYPDIDGLGLPELGAALVSRFPFCIPWDFVDTVKLLNADPVAPDIAVDLFPAAFKSKVGVTGSTEFRINLGDEKYQKIGTFCRWGALIGFCFGLAMLTKRMIWTA